MKHLIKFAFALLIAVAGTMGKSFAQTIPISNNQTFDSIRVVPNNPTSNDSIKLIIFVSNEATYRQFSHGSLDYISGDTIKISVSSLELSTPTDKFVDTISIGKLNPKQYVVSLTNRSTVCNCSVSPPLITTKYIDTAIFTLPTHAQTSAYFPFPNSNASWTVVDIGLGAPPPGTFTKFKTGNDTIIKTNLYKQIIAADYNDYKSYGTYYFAAVREINKKWFSVPPRDSIEYLFYDFSANVGDTIHSHYYFGISPQLDTINLIVKSIDSILIGNTYRKRIYLNSQGDYWIEGIGSLKGLFYPGVKGFDSDHKLLCFKENNTIIYYYPNYQNSCNDTLLGYEELFHNKTINIYPIEHSIIIETNTSEPLNIIFYDLFGRKLMEKFITDKHSELLFNYPTGLYFYQLFSISGVPQKQGKILLNNF